MRDSEARSPWELGLEVWNSDCILVVGVSVLGPFPASLRLRVPACPPGLKSAMWKEMGWPLAPD